MHSIICCVLRFKVCFKVCIICVLMCFLILFVLTALFVFRNSIVGARHADRTWRDVTGGVFHFTPSTVLIQIRFLHVHGHVFCAFAIMFFSFA